MAKGGGLSYIPINLRRSRVATAQLVQKAVELNIHVLLIQDAHVVEGKVTGFPLGWVISESNNCSCAIVILDRRLQAVTVARFNNSVFVNVTGMVEVLTVGTQYSAPSPDLGSDLN